MKMSADKCKELVSRLGDDEIRSLSYDWAFWACVLYPRCRAMWQRGLRFWMTRRIGFNGHVLASIGSSFGLRGFDKLQQKTNMPANKDPIIK